MRFVTCVILLVILAAGCGTIPPETVTPFVDYEDWYLVRDLTYPILDSDSEITVPAGFVTDYASVPHALCLLLPKDGRYSRPAIIHDFLYWSGDAVCTREQADQIMYLAMAEQGVDCNTRNEIYGALATFGSFAWQSNADERAASHHRVIPAALLPDASDQSGSAGNPVAGSTWEEFRGTVDAYYLGHPAESEPAGRVQVDWDLVRTRFEEYQVSARHPWWQFWKKDDCE